MEKEMLFEIETLQDWHLEANQIAPEEPVGGGGGCNSNCSNNSADQP